MASTRSGQIASVVSHDEGKFHLSVPKASRTLGVL